MSGIRESFGQNLKIIRKSKNYTQEKLAEKINIDIRQYSRIETGKGFPSLTTLENICDALNINPACLFEMNYDKSIYNKKSPEYEICMKIKKLSTSPSKMKFIELAIDAVNGNKKSIKKLQVMLDGMLLVS